MRSNSMSILINRTIHSENQAYTDAWKHQRWDQVLRRSKYQSESVYQKRLNDWYETHQTAFPPNEKLYWQTKSL
jgi:hypothetical protein